MFDRTTFYIDSTWLDLPKGALKVVALVSNNMDNEPVTIQDIARAFSVEKSEAKKWIDEGVKLGVVSVNEYGELAAHYVSA